MRARGLNQQDNDAVAGCWFLCHDENTVHPVCVRYTRARGRAKKMLIGVVVDPVVRDG